MEGLAAAVAGDVARQRANRLQPFTWQPSVLQLAGECLEAAEVLLNDTEGLRRELVRRLAVDGLLEQGERLWVRPCELPGGEATVEQALATLRRAPGLTFTLHGVCVAASTVFSRKYAAHVRCKMCNNEVVLVEGEKFSCCGGMADWEEDVNARVMVPAQVIRVAQLSTVAATQGTTLGIRQLSVHLWDDLCGRVHVGNRVLVVGAGTLLLPPAVRGVAAPRMLASTQFVASNLMVLNPAPVLINPHEHSPEARQYLQGMAGGELEAVLVCMRTWQRGLPCCQLLHVALLLSAAASGAKRVQLGEEAAPEDEEDQSEPEGFLPNSPGSRSRQQVNVLCFSEGPDPQVHALFHDVAANLCQQSVAARAADAKELLPRLDQKHVEPALQLTVPLAMGGAVAQASAGVLLLSSSSLTTKQALGLAQAVHAGQVALQPGCPELSVPITATLWTEVNAIDALGRAVQARGSACCPPAEAITNKFSLQFWTEQDIVLHRGQSENEEDMCADWLLGGLQPPEAGAVSSGSGFGGSGPTSRSGMRQQRQQQEDAQAALRYQLARAQTAAPPQLSEDAMAVLSAYFLLLRTHEEVGGELLPSLCRVAAASARLCGRAKVRPFPDAALAIAFAEERLAATGAFPAHWPRWAEELDRDTELYACLGGLLEDVCKAAGTAWGPGTELEWPEE